MGVSASAIPPAWRLAEALSRQPGLTLVPSVSADRVIRGELRCHRAGPDDIVVDREYSVSIELPPGFPKELPRVFETGGRVPRTFHTNPDKTLCLGSPIAQRLAIAEEPTVGGFIDGVIVPFLYAHAFHERYNRMPFGELAHGARGLEADLLRTFRLPRGTCATEFLRLASLTRRHANKRPCPCHSGVRVGRCHGAQVHQARRVLGRGVCAAESRALSRMR
ncbi:MAG: hypothetical protein JWL61_3703 [Gemmatimonadetes bacterium]|nr:hypothetical protein [Gemmatimonadota bacterium]